MTRYKTHSIVLWISQCRKNRGSFFVSAFFLQQFGHFAVSCWEPPPSLSACSGSPGLCRSWQLGRVVQVMWWQQCRFRPRLQISAPSPLLGFGFVVFRLHSLIHSFHDDTHSSFTHTSPSMLMQLLSSYITLTYWLYLKHLPQFVVAPLALVSGVCSHLAHC